MILISKVTTAGSILVYCCILRLLNVTTLCLVYKLPSIVPIRNVNIPLDPVEHIDESLNLVLQVESRQPRHMEHYLQGLLPPRLLRGGCHAAERLTREDAVTRGRQGGVLAFLRQTWRSFYKLYLVDTKPGQGL